MKTCQGQRGIAVAYVGIVIFTLLAFVGLSVDLGRAYVLRANLSKAVDAAALAAARYIGGGQTNARAEANKIFNVNFPSGYLGVSSVQNPPNITFQVASDGSNITTVTSEATLPTTFMRVGGYSTINVSASGQSIRRLVDMSFVIDHSGSLGSQYPQVQAAAQQFVQYFDPANDRIALILFAGNTIVMDAMNTGGRGFNQSSILNHISTSTTAGSTATSEALYAGWDQLRAVPTGSQSGLRVLVLFTDGAPNTFSGTFQVNTSHGSGPLISRTGALHTDDYPNVVGQGTNSPDDQGLYQIYGTPSSQGLQWVSPTSSSYASGGSSSPYTKVNPDIPTLPLNDFHPTHISSGIFTGFPLYTSSLSGQRALVGGNGSGYPNHVKNANNAARNLAEVIANNIRSDGSGAQPIRVYALGLGDLLNQNVGSMPETGTSILKRIANDPSSPSYNPAQKDGKYYFAGDTTQLSAAFAQIRDQIIRISQ
jgi:Flp pilus assembly protein TadG